MKQIFILTILLVLNSCNGQTQDKIDSPNKKSIITNNNYTKINFLDEKYKKNGFSISDNLTGDLYPSYSYLDKNVGAFSVNFIGKDKEAQYYWNINNPNGYFSKAGNPIDIANDSPKIRKKLELQKEKYYILVSLLDKKFIEKYDNKTQEFDINKEAVESIYLYENNKWILIKEIKEKNVPENSFSLYIKLISEYLSQKK
ncbi:hypothetical protein [Chryseobacterium sp.]|jgi:hypothetical protein|uniref:hypothetical protein n=1 Tax=Chryseobacterium sp. TaxID=1871047 RepID=UPI00283F3202|nr:hypothetical protein [Chryseobacterium sp.]MDR3025163.1 hypothetical protein [Chryseobacterium sp.]